MFRRYGDLTTMDGDCAEKLACQHLKRTGLRIRDRNYRTRRGEIDIIAQDGDTLVFVEVRYRRHSDYGSAAESIDLLKQRRIICAAQEFLQTKGLTDKVACRFDTVCISPAMSNPGQCEPRDPYRIEWLRNAFQSV